jgi:hypothetical protein
MSRIKLSRKQLRGLPFGMSPPALGIVQLVRLIVFVRVEYAIAIGPINSQMLVYHIARKAVRGEGRTASSWGIFDLGGMNGCRTVNE